MLKKMLRSTKMFFEALIEGAEMAKHFKCAHNPAILKSRWESWNRKHNV